MATKETLRDITTRSNPVVSAGEYGRPLAVVTSLFFMWGFLTCLNDILVPHLKSIFDLNYAQVMLVQFAFFSAYFLFSLPWSMVVNSIGYQRTMVLGLLTMACGAFLFVPAATAVSYPLFLAALLVLADPYTLPTDLFLDQVNTDYGGVRVHGGMASGPIGSSPRDQSGCCSCTTARKRSSRTPPSRCGTSRRPGWSACATISRTSSA